VAASTAAPARLSAVATNMRAIGMTDTPGGLRHAI
jgi:hypothetical protein